MCGCRVDRVVIATSGGSKGEWFYIVTGWGASCIMMYYAISISYMEVLG